MLQMSLTNCKATYLGEALVVILEDLREESVMGRVGKSGCNTVRLSLVTPFRLTSLVTHSKGSTPGLNVQLHISHHKCTS